MVASIHFIRLLWLEPAIRALAQRTGLSTMILLADAHDTCVCICVYECTVNVVCVILDLCIDTKHVKSPCQELTVPSVTNHSRGRLH
jgi:hypothetical protein